jgi:restriction endonuclease S subunit
LSINNFSKLGSGILGNGSLNKKSLEQLKILIPSLDKQKEIVEYCEYNDTLIKLLEKEIENNKKLAQQFITDIIKTKVQEEQNETSSVNIESFDEVENKIASVEEDVVESKVKNKKIVKKVKKPLEVFEV